MLQLMEIARFCRSLAFRFMNPGDLRFTCPICRYHGPFETYRSPTGERKYAQCPHCRGLERHRLQRLVMEQLFPYEEAVLMKMLHIAPEPFFMEKFRSRFGSYVTGDLTRTDVDSLMDITDLPFEDATFDVVYASHVLEHVANDRKAIREIFRVLKHDGLAVLPVPVMGSRTVEYGAAIPGEEFHVRFTGTDYFDRYKEVFPRVSLFRSEDFPLEYQLYVYEDRTTWPRTKFPKRLPTGGERHSDIVPVCYREDKGKRRSL